MIQHVVPHRFILSSLCIRLDRIELTNGQFVHREEGENEADACSAALEWFSTNNMCSLVDSGKVAPAPTNHSLPACYAGGEVQQTVVLVGPSK